MTIKKRLEQLEKKYKPAPEINVQVAIVDDISGEVTILKTGEVMSLEEYEKRKNPDAINIQVYGE